MLQYVNSRYQLKLSDKKHWDLVHVWLCFIKKIVNAKIHYKEYAQEDLKQLIKNY